MPLKRISIQIRKASLVFEKYANQLLLPYDLTVSQFKILMLLLRSKEGGLHQTDLERCFCMTNPTVTGLVQNLEKKGLICRKTDPEDKRSKLLTPSAHALAVKEELFALSDQLEARMTENLTEEECSLLRGLLAKILNEPV